MIFKIAVTAFTKACPQAQSYWNDLRDAFLDSKGNGYNYNTETEFTVKPENVGSDVYMVVDAVTDNDDELEVFLGVLDETGLCNVAAQAGKYIGEYITVDGEFLQDAVENDGFLDLADYPYVFNADADESGDDYDLDANGFDDLDQFDDLDLEENAGECVGGECGALDEVDFNEDYDSIFDDDFDDLNDVDDETPDTIYFDEIDVPEEDDYSWESDLRGDISESYKAIDRAFKAKKKGCCGGGKKGRSKRLNESLEVSQHEYGIAFLNLGEFIFGLKAENVQELLLDAFTYDADDVEANYNDYCGYEASIETEDGEDYLVIREVDGMGAVSTFAYVFNECLMTFKANAPRVVRTTNGILDNFWVSEDGVTRGDFVQALADEDIDAYEEMVDLKYVSPSKQKWVDMNEARKPIRRSNNRLVSLSEALKAMEPSDQKKLDKAVKTVEDVIKAVKGQTIGEAEARDAMKKLKAQQNALKKIKKDEENSFNLTDVKGTAAVIKKLIAADPANADKIKKFSKSLTESVVAAISNRQRSLHTNVTIDKKPVPEITTKALIEAYNTAKGKKEQYINALRETAVGTAQYEKVKNAIANKSNMMAMIAEELAYRKLAAKVLNKLNEDEEQKSDDADTGSTSSMDDLAAMFGTSPEELAAPEESNDDTAAEDSETDDATDEDSEEVELARVVIQMADKESAEQLRDICKDAGIPEDAMEIEGGEEESVDELEDGEAETEDEETEDAEGDANESIRYSNIRKLFEAEEEDGADDTEAAEDDDAPAEGEEADAESDDTEEEAEDDGAVKFILTDTDYIDQLAKVLEDDYGITSEEFEEMIGGEIVSADSDDIDEPAKGESKDADDKGDDAEKKDDEDEESEDDLTAADLFGNM